MNASRGRRRSRTRVIAPLLAATSLVLVPTAARAASADCPRLDVAAGTTTVIPATMRLCSLSVPAGAMLAAPAGHSLSLTVDGVETGSALTETGGTTTAIQPGLYRGRIVLEVTDENLIPWQSLTFPFRQGLYVGVNGVDPAKSVTSAVTGGAVTATSARDIAIRSTGEAFNGVYVNGAPYTLLRPQITLQGNGRSDFVGYGAAVTATGTSTKLVLDGAQIANSGVVRTGVVATGGSNVVVKNSRISTQNGTLPTGYQSTVDLAYMEQAPWMLGIVGNVRATNLLGDNTKASYINSSISSQGWGVLSTDTGSNTRLTAINSHIATTGDEGYGSYAIGNATEQFLGSRLDVQTYAAINRGGTIHYGDSTPSAVASLNSTLGLGLTPAELAAIVPQATVINSARWGVMWHGAGSVAIDGHTQLISQRASFLDKGQAVDISVDGSQGARVVSKNGTIVQVMEDDDPGPVFVDGKLVNAGVYTEPTGTPTKVDTFDVTAAHSDDAVATFTDTSLTGDFYNGIRGNNPPGPFGPGLQGKNLVLTFDGSRITGALTASTTAHNQSTITAADYQQIGVVTNTASPVVNNGVVVDLTDNSTWTVTKTSYLSKLTVSADSSVRAPKGKVLSVTVDGVPTVITPGQTYTGAITVSVN